MLKQYFDLILYKTYADLRAETERTYLGFLWWVFEPILFMGVFYLVFGVLFNNGIERFTQFLLIGLVTWQWFKSSLAHGEQTILANRPLIQQIYLPKIVFPIILVLTDSVKFVFIFVLLLVFLWSTGSLPGTAYLALPLVLFVELLFILACTLLLAAIVPFIPDLRFVTENFLTAVFFMSGLFFKAAETVPPHLQFYFYLNPMANLIEDYRHILMYNQLPNWTALLVIALVSLAGIVFSAWLIRRFEFLYPKITA